MRIKTAILRSCLFVLSFWMVACSSVPIVKTIQVETLAKTNSSWDGSRLPAYPKGEAEITMIKVTIPPHTKLPWHKHPVISAGVMLEGELVVRTDEGKVLHLKKGDSIVEVVDKWHYGENKGDKPVVIIAFYVGEKGAPISIKRD